MTISVPESDKLTCIDQQLEMNSASDEFWLFRNSRWDSSTAVRCTLKLQSPDGDKIEIVVDAPDLQSAVGEAYTRFRRHIERVPEFNANRTIELQAADDSETHATASDDEIPF